MKPYLSKLIIGIAFAYAVFFPAVGSAQSQEDPSNYKTNAKGFIENKGQIIDQNHLFNSDVKYLFNSAGFNVQLRQTGFSYDTYTDVYNTPIDAQQIPGAPANRQHPQNFTRLYHRVDVELPGSNPNAQMITEGKSHEYYNYLTSYAPQGGVSNVHFYTKVIYKDIYPNIDLEFFTSATTQNNVPVEYQFVVHTGGNPSDIKLAYNGANSVGLTDGKLVVNVNSGNFTETIPSSYFKADGQAVNVSYRSLGNNVFAFSLPNNTAITSDLVIDPKPDLYWGTYYGGSGDDEGYSITADASGNTFVTGTTSSSSDIATAGEYQTTYGGDYDVFVAEFDPFNSGSAQLVWSSYYGGSGNDEANGIAIDADDNVFITGSTSSTSGIATVGAYQTTPTGIFIAEINAGGGSLAWGTYYGASGNDYSSGLALDASDNVYIAGYTASTSGIATSGAYQTTISSGTHAFVAEINAGGSSRAWGTYYGGNGTDEAWGIALDPYNDSYITGQTSSTSGIATAGAYQTTYGGATDAFVAAIKYNGSTLLGGTYYGGSSYDVAWGIAEDASGNAYITGQTESNNIGLSTDPYDTTYGVTGRTTFGEVLLAEFSANLTTLNFGTYYAISDCDDGGGGPPPIPPDFYGYAIALDANANIYITGQIQGGMCGGSVTTDTAWQTSLDGYDNAFVAKFDPNYSGTSQLVWGTYFSGDGYSEGWGIATNGVNQVYVTGLTNASPGTYDTTADAYQTHFGGDWDVFVGYFDTTVVSGGGGGRSVSAVTPVSPANESITVYPTIQNNSTVLNVTIPADNTGLIDIYDLMGRKTAEFILASGDNRLSLSSLQLSPEMYMYRVTLNDNSVQTGKLIWGQ